MQLTNFGTLVQKSMVFRTLQFENVDWSCSRSGKEAGIFIYCIALQL
jgi:hypothetical protein